MKNKLPFTVFVLSLFLNLEINAQIINEPANWPNTNWTIGGSYNVNGFFSDPTSTPNFGWNDDVAGNTSLGDRISAESPIINLTPAIAGGETQLQVSFDYVYKRNGDEITLQWWDGSFWQVWGSQLGDTSPNSGDYENCISMQSFVSEPLVISTLNASQLLGFRYRINYFDNAGWQYGFCIGSPTLISLDTPSCINVSAITINASDITSSTAIVSWTDSNGIIPTNGWEIEYGVSGFTLGTGTTITTTTNPFTLTGLTSSTTYDVYIRALCSVSEQSNWAGPISFTTLQNVAECGGQFVDSGGTEGNYSNNETIVTTICPTVTGEVVTVNFTSFNTESGYDTLTIYNGASTFSPVFGTYTGNNIPPILTSTDSSGCITFRFESDGTQTREGWIANITCSPPPTCFVPNNLTVNNITLNGGDFNWNDTNATSPANGWEVVIVPAGQLPDTGTPIIVTTLPYTENGLNPTTSYDFYVRAVCDDNGNIDPSFWTGPLSFNTLIAPPECNGVFVDPGGPSNNYSNNITETYTICPDDAGDVVTVIFQYFDLEESWDGLMIYNGPTTASPLISSGSMYNRITCPNGAWTGTTNFAPGIITSTDSSGCLTFVFTSDTSFNNAGWLADVLCTEPPTCYIPDNVTITNITHNNAEINWVDTNTPPPLNGWEIEIVLTGTTPTGTGVMVSGLPYIINTLTPDTDYDIYIRAVCDDAGNLDPSFWVGPFNIQTEIVPPECGDIFTDDGGLTNNYSNNINNVTVICPDVAGEIVTVEFESFNVQEGFDSLTIYDGNSVSAPLLGVFEGTDLPPTFISTHPSGCLTFVFQSNGFINQAGWEANVDCIPEPTCWFVTNLSTGATTTTSVELTWTDINTTTPAGGWNIEYGTTGFTQGTGTVINATTNPFVVTGLLSSTNYDFYIQANCAIDGSNSSTWSGPILGTTDNAPPSNDTCATAVPLSVNTVCNNTTGNNILATSSSILEGEIVPDCADPLVNTPSQILDVWFTFVVPNSGNFVIETSNAGGMNDTVLSAYSGSCGNLVELDCKDDSVIIPNSEYFRFSSIKLRNLTAGDIIYLRVWSYPAYTSDGLNYLNVQGAFNICVYEDDINRGGVFNQLNFSDIILDYYPNPIKDVLNIKSNEQISNIFIYNVLGELVLNKEYSRPLKSIELHTNSLSNGTYFVKTIYPKGSKTFKIIKSR